MLISLGFHLLFTFLIKPLVIILDMNHGNNAEDHKIKNSAAQNQLGSA